MPVQVNKERPLSRASLFAAAKERLKKRGHCLLPAVTQKIIHLSESNPGENDDCQRIIHLDLISAINTGVATDVFMGSPPCLTIRGIDCEGRHLLVIVEVPSGEKDALLITDFAVTLN